MIKAREGYFTNCRLSQIKKKITIVLQVEYTFHGRPKRNEDVEVEPSLTVSVRKSTREKGDK